MTRRVVARTAAIPLAVMAILGLVAGPSVAQDASGVPTGPPAATPLAVPPEVPAGDGTGVRFTTELGDILIGVFTESSPVAATNFVDLARSGYYDGTPFHRVVPGFVIQGGSPDGTGNGGPGYTIPDEPVVGSYGRGIVAMARTRVPDSQGSQFFIVLDDSARGALDSARTYAIIGRVLEGMEVVDAIAAMPNQPGDDTPVDPVLITDTAIETVEMPVEVAPTPTPATDDPELMARVPSTVGGSPLAPTSISGFGLTSEFGAGDPLVVVLQEYATERGHGLEDLSLVVAGVDLANGQPVDLTGIRLRGTTPTADDVQALARIVSSSAAPIASPFPMAGHDGFMIIDSASPVPVAAIIAGDTVWLIRTADTAARDELVTVLAGP